MMHAIPGGPFDGHDMPLSEAVRAKLMAQLGLDQPLWVQYVNYMSGVLRFDFGVPFQSPGETVLSLLANAWPPSLILGGARRPDRRATRHSAWHGRRAAPQHLDRLPRLGVATLGLTVPVFVISMLLILVFAVWLHWLPASGWGKPERWILPIVAYAAIPLATYARYTRSAMLDTLNRPFVTALRAKGLSETPHHLPACAAQLGDPDGRRYSCRCSSAPRRVRSSSRRCSACPGLGAYFVSSIENRDYPLEMALMLMVTLMFCVAYLHLRHCLRLAQSPHPHRRRPAMSI